MQGPWVPSLVRENPPCWGAAEPTHLEPVLRNRRRFPQWGHQSAARKWLRTTSGEGPQTATKTWCSLINYLINFKSCYLFISCAQLFGDPMDSSPAGFSLHGISQATIPERIAISFSGGCSWLRDWTCVSGIGRHSLLLIHQGSPLKTLQEASLTRPGSGTLHSCPSPSHA